jgi:benzoyl-CoA reductase subunit C
MGIKRSVLLNGVMICVAALFFKASDQGRCYNVRPLTKPGGEVGSVDPKIVFTSGRMPIGYLCTATPPEILYAAGGHPFRLSGTGENLESVEGLAHPNLCGFCKSALAWTKALDSDQKIIVAAAASCDGCRRLTPLFETLEPVTASIAFDLPRTSGERDLAYFRSELRTLYKELSEALGTTADDDKLAAAIKRYREARSALSEAAQAAMDGRLPIQAAFEASDAYFTMLPEESTVRCREILAGALDEPKSASGPKVLLAGNISLGPGPAQALIEAGAQVVGLDLCNVERAANIQVDDGDDPIAALADSVYKRPLCPRFEPGLDWGRRLAERAEKLGAKAIVLYSIKFCDNTLYAFPSMRRFLQEQGLSVLTLEGEYSNSVPGQIATRIEAFIEML